MRDDMVNPNFLNYLSSLLLLLPPNNFNPNDVESRYYDLMSCFTFIDMIKILGSFYQTIKI